VAFKRREEPSIEEERQALRAQHAALEDLKRQLAERVDAVRERELELHHVLAEAGSGRPRESQPVLPSPPSRAPAAADDEEEGTGEDALAAKRREEALTAREQALAEREARALEQERALDRRAQELAAAAKVQQAASGQAPPAPRVDEARPEEDAERLARIEARLEELREAEKLFLRTRDELAARSEAVAARERLVAQKERELDEQEDASPWATAELSEVEARLRRLEQQQAQLPPEQPAGFSGGLRKLQQGTTKPPRPA
jgi:hypothetical protein